MEGIISFGNKRNYDDFKKQIPTEVYHYLIQLENSASN